MTEPYTLNDFWYVSGAGSWWEGANNFQAHNDVTHTDGLYYIYIVLTRANYDVILDLFAYISFGQRQRTQAQFFKFLVRTQHIRKYAIT